MTRTLFTTVTTLFLLTGAARAGNFIPTIPEVKFWLPQQVCYRGPQNVPGFGTQFCFYPIKMRDRIDQLEIRVQELEETVDCLKILRPGERIRCLEGLEG